MAKKKREKFQTIRNTNFNEEDKVIDNLFAKIKKQEANKDNKKEDNKEDKKIRNI